MIKICPACGKGYESFKGNQIYCSAACRSREYARIARANKEKETRACIICGKEFHPSNHFRSYCSIECQLVRVKSYEIDCACEYCGKTFGASSYKRFCSEQCENSHRGSAAVYGEKEQHLNAMVNIAKEKGISYGQLKAMEYLNKHKMDIGGTHGR